MTADTSLPDYLPARMVNEFVYCPRLFYYEWVEGVFEHNRETVEGSLRHQRVDTGTGALPPTDDLPEDQRLHSRSVMLSSDRYGLIAKMDLIETSGKAVVPVDYKRGKPRKGDDGLPQVWDTDRAQIAVQALVLRDNGYQCDEGILYYVATKQRVRVPVDETLIAQTLETIRQAREIAASGRIPPPLEDSPKCPRCSLVTLCLPDETAACRQLASATQRTRQLTLFEVDESPRVHTELPALDSDVRRLIPARDDLRPLYLNTPGLRVGVSRGVLQVRKDRELVQEVRIGEICQINVMGHVQLTTQAIQTLCRNEVPIAYFSQGGWFYGVTHGFGLKNVFLRRAQFRLADVPSFCLRMARAFVAGKIRNQRTMLMRNHVEPPPVAVAHLKCMYEDALRAQSTEELLGIEGNAARIYFEHFAGMIKVGQDPSDEAPADPSAASRFAFDFTGRNRRPPRDPVNALLSLAYSVLAKDLAVTCHIVGLDPYLGFYHQPRFGRPSLALDLMEPFRPLIADSAVLTAINTRMISPSHFLRAGRSVALTPEGRQAFFRAYEQRMDALITHPLFGYRVNYRRMLEIQTRLLGRVLTGELSAYPVFTTR